MNDVERQPISIFKTILDYIVTLLCLTLLIPIIIILSLSIKFEGTGPVIYSQKRLGINGKPFNIYNFRSMYSGNEEGIALISDRDDERITPLEDL